jgi:hypothetical protein
MGRRNRKHGASSHNLGIYCPIDLGEIFLKVDPIDFLLDRVKRFASQIFDGADFRVLQKVALAGRNLKFISTQLASVYCLILHYAEGKGCQLVARVVGDLGGCSNPIAEKIG